MIRVLVAHDTYLLRSALAALLGREPDFDVTDAAWPQAGEGTRLLAWPQAGDATRSSVPHVRVVDADCTGWRERAAALAAAADREPSSALVVLTVGGKPGNVRRAYEAQALGYVNKDRSPDRLPEAVRQAAQGKRFVDESLAMEFLQAADMPLTRRELSVLSLSAEGAGVTEIARSLHLSNGTVRNYLAAITRKTGARNRVDAIRISQVAGWV